MVGSVDEEEIIEVLKGSERAMVLTGAGVSAESGVPTFRGEDGLWRRFRAEELATPQAFASDPVLVWEWYDWRRGIISKAEPNEAHFIIAQMEDYYKDFLLATQNVDGLHRKAGNRRMVELHGNIWRVRCLVEGKIFEDNRVPLPEIPPRCSCGAILRPDVVWFGEALPQHAVLEADLFARSCDLMLVVGTSGVVYPVASLPSIAKNNDAYVLEVNLERTPITSVADASLFGRATKTLSKIWKLESR